MKTLLADWWCALNAQQWPSSLPQGEGPITEERMLGAWQVVNALACADGLRLWRQRCDDGVDPGSGVRFARAEGEART